MKRAQQRGGIKSRAASSTNSDAYLDPEIDKMGMREKGKQEREGGATTRHSFLRTFRFLLRGAMSLLMCRKPRKDGKLKLTHPKVSPTRTTPSLVFVGPPICANDIDGSFLG